MATVSKSYTATGTSASLMVKFGDSFTYTISGTYAATVQIQKSADGGQSWETIATNSTANATVTNVVVSNEAAGGNLSFRSWCSAYTSGTCVVSLVDSTTEVIPGSEIKNKNMVTVFAANENGVAITGNLDVSGTISTGVSGGTDFTVNVSDDVSITSGDAYDVVVGNSYTETVAVNYTSTVTGARTLSCAEDTVIEGTGSGDDVILQAPFVGSRVLINGGLTLIRATTAISASTSYQNILGVTDNTSARTVTLAAAMNLAGRVVWVMDEAGTSGNAAANPITVTPASGTIDGFASDIINKNYAGKAYYGDGTNWHTFAVIPGVTRLLINGYAKVGGTAGWTFGAATNIGRLGTVAASQTGAKLVVPITGLPVGATIIAFHLLGQIESAGGTVTLDAELRKLTAAAADLTDATVSSMTQISVTADTAVTEANSLKTLASAEVVNTDESFYMILTATTAASTDIDMMAVVVHYRS